MAVVIRLRREGSKDRPYYKVVVADSRSPRDGRFIEQVGNYNPMQEDSYKIDLEKVDKWIGDGAKPSSTVSSLIKKARKYDHSSRYFRFRTMGSSLNKFNPEVVILTNNYFDQYPINNNNLIVIRKT